MAHYLVGMKVQLVSEQRLQCFFLQCARGNHRTQIDPSVWSKAVVHTMIHMDSQARNKSHIPIKRDQLALNAIPYLNHNAARKGKRTIEPGVIDHSSIRLNV